MIIPNVLSWHFCECPLWPFIADRPHARLFDIHPDPIAALNDSKGIPIAVYCASWEGDQFVVHWGAYADKLLLVRATKFAANVLSRQRDHWSKRHEEDALIHGFHKLAALTERGNKYHGGKSKDIDDLTRAHAEARALQKIWDDRCRDAYYQKTPEQWQADWPTAQVSLWHGINLVVALLDPLAQPTILRSVLDFITVLPNKEKPTLSEMNEVLAKELQTLADNSQSDEELRGRDWKVMQFREGLGRSNPWRGKKKR